MRKRWNPPSPAGSSLSDFARRAKSEGRASDPCRAIAAEPEGSLERARGGFRLAENQLNSLLPDGEQKLDAVRAGVGGDPQADG
jgi:hypothetical protein